ncbi:uncharacterized protein LOC120684556 [Panicum virgatum]|uniref:uncharacterized protein LOC120684556 n=1 Tax=Panicum virgatum TaxID=38727 RepID=UPI0019D5D512|nr:uncharacterized protein LOC120684556 [Panicum virgatum]
MEVAYSSSLTSPYRMSTSNLVFPGGGGLNTGAYRPRVRVRHSGSSRTPARQPLAPFCSPVQYAPLWSLDWPNWKAATCRQSRGKARGGHLHIHSFNCYLWCAQARSNPR